MVIQPGNEFEKRDQNGVAFPVQTGNTICDESEIELCDVPLCGPMYTLL